MSVKAYIGTKIVLASPATAAEFESVHGGRGWTGPRDAPGYTVQYDNRYFSWSPAEVFIAAYRPVSLDEFALIGTAEEIAHAEEQER